MRARNGRLMMIFAGVILFVLGACRFPFSLPPSAQPTERVTPRAVPTATLIPGATATLAPRPTPAPTNPPPEEPTRTPTLTGGGSGDLIFQSNFNLFTGQFSGQPLQIVYQAYGSNQPAGMIFTRSGVAGMDWSPDGRQLLFSAQNFLGTFQLFVFDIGRGGISGQANVKQIYIGPAGGIDPAWSDDGEWIAFISSPADSKNRRLCVIDADGKNMRCLLEHFGRMAQPDWSPDGQTIVFFSDRCGASCIYRIDLGEDIPIRISELGANASAPQFSPDGRWIVYSTDRDKNYEIYKVRPDGSENTRLTQQAADDLTPAWSPDGRWISFFRRNAATGSTTLCNMRADGSDLACREDFPAGNNLYPRWRPEIRLPQRLHQPTAHIYLLGSGE